MKVTPSSPFETSFGLWVSPVRGVTAECRTRRVNWPARLRSASFFNEDFNINSTRNFLQVRGQADPRATTLWGDYRLFWSHSLVYIDARERRADSGAKQLLRGDSAAVTWVSATAEKMLSNFSSI